MSSTYDVIIIGGGFYGLRIAQFMREELGVEKLLIIEKEAEVMQRASYNNQARVHNGYHYPRSILTALRSRVNLPVFSREFQAAVVNDFENYYGIATAFSKVSATQFERFFDRIGAETERAPETQKSFNPKLIERIFKVKEFAFNTTVIKEQLVKRLAALGVTVHVGESVDKISRQQTGLEVVTNKKHYRAKLVLNTTYSAINHINKMSGLPIIPLKHELTELCLVNVPPELEHKAFTIMCGPFFSLMPFPAKNCYTLSHVRYTPHSEWHDSEAEVRNGRDYLQSGTQVSHFKQMISDMKRYLPMAKDIVYTGKSLWEVKTVLPQSENDDSRPIMYLQDHGGLKNYVCIMGGKIDNIYDVFRELRETYGQA